MTHKHILGASSEGFSDSVDDAMDQLLAGLVASRSGINFERETICWSVVDFGGMTASTVKFDDNSSLILIDETFLMWLISFGNLVAVRREWGRRVDPALKGILRCSLIKMRLFGATGSWGSSFFQDVGGTWPNFEIMLSYVLAHEIAHHALGHGGKSIQFQGVESVEIDGADPTHELEADRFAVELLTSTATLAGGGSRSYTRGLVLNEIRSVHAAMQFWETGYFIRPPGSHPRPAIRSAALEASLDSYPPEPIGGGMTRRIRMARRLNEEATGADKRYSRLLLEAPKMTAPLKKAEARIAQRFADRHFPSPELYESLLGLDESIFEGAFTVLDSIHHLDTFVGHLGQYDMPTGELTDLLNPLSPISYFDFACGLAPAIGRSWKMSPEISQIIGLQNALVYSKLLSREGYA